MLGPLSTDIVAGYDHVVAAIGAAQSACYGTDLIFYITPAEHLALPNTSDVVEGVKATCAAAHIGELAKYPGKTRHRDVGPSLIVSAAFYFLDCKALLQNQRLLQLGDVIQSFPSGQQVAQAYGGKIVHQGRPQKGRVDTRRRYACDHFDR